jgi:hypothetical protein
VIISICRKVKSVWNIEDSQVGSGTIEAEAKLVNSLIELTLRWRGDNEQPEIWKLSGGITAIIS